MCMYAKREADIKYFVLATEQIYILYYVYRWHRPGQKGSKKVL